MMIHKGKMQRKQAFLFRTVDIAMEIFAMSACISRVRTMYEEKHPETKHARELCDLFCRNSRRKVQRLFRELWRNDDVRKYRVGQSVLKGEQRWFEAETMGAMPQRHPAREAERV
jgi:hypothetical protein